MRTYLFKVPVNGVQLLSSSFFTTMGKAMKGVLLDLMWFFNVPMMNSGLKVLECGKIYGLIAAENN
jgi:hypothetical protein